MTRRIIGLAIFAALALGTTALLAHEQMEFAGTITQKDDTRLEVTTKEEKYPAQVAYEKSTIILRGEGEKVDASALKIGQSVIVDAMAEGWDDIQAYQIRIVEEPKAK